MTITPVTINASFNAPDGSPLADGTLIFRTRRWDLLGADIVVPDTITAPIVAGAASISAYASADGVKRVGFDVDVEFMSATAGRIIRQSIARDLVIPDAGPVDLGALLDDPLIMSNATGFDIRLRQELQDARDQSVASAAASQRWAESAASPDGTSSKSAKSWAEEAEASAGEAAADRVQTGLDRNAAGASAASAQASASTASAQAGTATAKALESTSAAAASVSARDQAALYAGTYGPGMILHRTDEAIPAGWWDTGLRQSATSELWGNTATLALISNWSTASLYTGGIATAWFDFSTMSREFQDTIGTAITAPGQSVGMVRDAISPLSFGPELVVNGDFAADANWTKGTGWTISSGAANKAAGTAASLSQAITLTAGRTYRIAGTATVTAGTVTPRFTGGTIAAGTAISAGGAFAQYVTAATGNATLDFLATSTFSGSIDNISVQEVLGVVATQPSASLRGRWASWPVTGRRNLLGSSSLLGGTSGAPGDAPTGWIYVTTGTPTATLSADSEGVNGQSWRALGGTTDRLQLGATVGLNANTTYCFSAIVDVTTAVAIQQHVTWSSTPAGSTLTYQLNGAVVTNSTIVPVGRHTIAAILAVGSTQGQGNARLGGGLQGTGSSFDLTFRQPQVEVGTTRGVYQRTSTGGDDITQSGVRNAGMWRPDLVDDALTFNLPAAADGELILMGRDGSWKEPRPASAGSAVTIGGTGAGTLATPGILRATGPLVAAGFRAGALTADEWLRLKRRWRSEGARGELILGPETLPDPGFDTGTGWIAGAGWSISGGQAIRVSDAAGSSVSFIPPALVVGQKYLTTIVMSAVSGAGVRVSLNGIGAFIPPLNSTPGTYAVVLEVFSGASTLRIEAAANATCTIDSASFKLLIPEY